MSDPLATYINDHLAGSAYAIDLVEFMPDTYEGQELGQFAAWLLAEIEADREALQGLAERVGGGSSKAKELTAWGWPRKSAGRSWDTELTMAWPYSKRLNSWRLEFTES